MKEPGRRAKLFLLALIMTVISIPGLQSVLRLSKEKPLVGAAVVPEFPQFHLDSLFSGRFQNDFEIWLNEKLGFHYTLIRLRNQVWYWCFKAPAMQDAIIGKEDYLYAEGYVTAYTGKDFIGHASINTMTKKLKAIQDTLAAHNVTLVVVFAPGKASIYPQYVPDSYGKPAAETNHSVMRHTFDSAGVNLVDFDQYYIDRRNSTKFPIYPKVGVHWTNYAALVAMDSLIHYIEKKRNIDLPNVIFKGEEWSAATRDYDDDVGSGLNLLIPIKNYPMAYPKYEIEDTAGKAHINMMSVADSYIRMMMFQGLSTKVTANHDYWYYNQGIEHSDGSPKTSTLDEDVAKSTMKHDVVMIMATEMNLAGFSWGYINDAYRTIVEHQPIPEKEKRIRQLENVMRMDKRWLYTIQQKAIANKFSLDSMMRRDAEYIVEHQEDFQKH